MFITCRYLYFFLICNNSWVSYSIFLPLHLKISSKEVDITAVFLNRENEDSDRDEINEKSPQDQSRTELHLFPSRYLATYSTKAGGELSDICIS